MPEQPLAEVFGYPIDNFSEEAKNARAKNLCPFRSETLPDTLCTKDSKTSPLGVCSVFGGGEIAITCPVRFIQSQRMVSDAAKFFFPAGASWRALPEVRLRDSEEKPVGNVDFVLVSYDEQNRVLDYGALEVQSVYISGNVRDPFTHYMDNPVENYSMNWRGQPKYPRTDYLSSSRKRLAPQLISKGGIFSAWNRKMAVALNTGFFDRLPELEQVNVEDAEIAWLIYDLQMNADQNRYQLVLHRTVYTKFESALLRITQSEAGTEAGFLSGIQNKLKERLNAHRDKTIAELDPNR